MSTKHVPTTVVESQILPASPMAMLERAITQGAGIDVLDRLMSLQDRWEKAQARKAFDEAIAAAKAEIPPIRKNRTVSFGGGRASYQHEDLAEIERTIKPILGKFGLSYRFRTETRDGQVVVTCVLAHKLGHYEENSLPAAPDTTGSKNAIQALGSAVTYLQRYTLKAALGLAASADDDGQSAGGNGGAINDEQLAELDRLIKDTKSNVSLLCQYVGVKCLEDIPASRLPDLISKLRLKQQTAAKQ